MGERRASHTATLLQNGTVLVTGGVGRSSSRLAELYDPSDDTWSSTGSMNDARVGHGAVLLDDGRVLVAGSGPSVEIYDPDTGTWAYTVSPSLSIRTPELKLLEDGRVLHSGTPSSVFDLPSLTWTDTPMVTGHIAHAATRLGDGTVLAAGGRVGAVSASREAELFDPATSEWTETERMGSPRLLHGIVRLPNGDALAVGGQGVASLGCDDNYSLASSEEYDLIHRTWRTLRPLNTGRADHTVTNVLRRGESEEIVLAAGGFVVKAICEGEVFWGVTNTAEIYVQ